MPGEYASFAMRAVSLGRKRGRPPVLSSNAFYPFAAERRLASLLKAELARSVRESLASALGRLSDDGEDDGWTEGFLSGTDRAASEIVLNAREAFSRFSEMTVGTPYYPPDVEERVKDDWKAEFLACCKSADSDAKADIARALTEAKERGWNRAQAEAAVLERLDPKYAKRAELIARTETGKLNNAATMATYRSAGVEYYVWLATPDERTRPSHAALNGKICAVGDPDHWYEDNPDDPLRPVAHGRGKDMYHGDPGTDFQCRCTSIPWDPRIDSKYRVRKVPEPERKPTELETARAETEKARGELEAATVARREAERKLEILRAANARHAGRISGYRERLEERFKQRRERDRAFAKMAEKAKARKVSFLKVERLRSMVSEEEIIRKLSGGDSTSGSCSSLAFAYAGNRAGFDVVDFRGGTSCDFFARLDNIKEIVKSGGDVSSDYNGFKVAEFLLQKVEENREYYFACGQHAAIIRKVGQKFEYLEMQSRYDRKNGFHELTAKTLKERFSVKKSRTSYGTKLPQSGTLIDIAKLKDSAKFRELLGFINTPPSRQKKGKLGGVK